MSIVYFPKIYPDELVSSVLARYYAQSGYITYKNADKNIFVSGHRKIDKEFVKNIRPEAIEQLTRNMAFEELLEKHTMYPYYGRFLDKDRRDAAYEALRNNEGDFLKLFGGNNTKKTETRYMRYCPLCAKSDRGEYGETYWHRIPQIKNINVCHIHGCYFKNSEIPMNSEADAKIKMAEECIPETYVVSYSKKPVQIKLAKYVAAVFESPVDRKQKVTIDKFLRYKMRGTKYLSVRGEYCYYSKLYREMQGFYNGMEELENITQARMQRLMSGDYRGFEVVCMTAMMLGIDKEELVTMHVPRQSPEKQFDQKVKELMDKGMSMAEVARKMNADPSLVRMSVTITQKKTAKGWRGGNIDNNNHIKNWDKLDELKLEEVKRAIEDLHGYKGTRPVKISYYAVGKRTGISGYQLERMKKCKRVIEDNIEPAEKYNARKVIWALDRLEEENKPIMLWRLNDLIKLERKELVEAFPYIKQIEPNKVEIIKELLYMEDK